MWDFIYFFWSFSYWVILVILTPVISYFIYIYTGMGYIFKGIWVFYLSLGKFSTTLSCSFFVYLLIFLYLFSTHLWQSVLLTKNFNLKHISGSTIVVKDYNFLVSLVSKKKHILWYYYFIYYII